MKLAIALSGILGLAAANVSIFPQVACGGVGKVIGTSMGTCYNVNTKSAKGCATPYVLRLHEQSGCADPYVHQCPNDQCCGLGGVTIKSFKCVLA